MQISTSFSVSMLKFGRTWPLQETCLDWSQRVFVGQSVRNTQLYISIFYQPLYNWLFGNPDSPSQQDQKRRSQRQLIPTYPLSRNPINPQARTTHSANQKSTTTLPNQPRSTRVPQKSARLLNQQIIRQPASEPNESSARARARQKPLTNTEYPGRIARPSSTPPPHSSS